jgi:outer membrane lipoprotein-sorting protein
VPLLIVGDGKALTMIDYQVKQVSRWPIGNSPLSVLLNPNQDLSRRSPRSSGTTIAGAADLGARSEAAGIRHDHHRLRQGAERAGGLMLQGWTTVDAQNNRTTVKLSNQRFNVAVADSAFRFVDPRKRSKAK